MQVKSLNQDQQMQMTDISMIASDQSTQGLIDGVQVVEVTDTHADTVISSPPRPNVDAYKSTTEVAVPEGAESAESHHELLPTGDISAQLIFHKDVGYLSFNPLGRPLIDAGLKENMVKLGTSYFQNADAAMPKTNYGAKGIARGMTRNWFIKEMPNGEQIHRTWLLYSPMKKAAFCFCCLLFPTSPANARSSFESTSGFDKWKKLEKVKTHEDTQYHRRSFLEWKEAELTLKGHGVDECLEKQISDEKTAGVKY
jgi:hypothetical protein